MLSIGIKSPKTLGRPTVLMRVSGKRAADSFWTWAAAAGRLSSPADHREA